MNALHKPTHKPPHITPANRSSAARRCRGGVCSFRYPIAKPHILRAMRRSYASRLTQN